MRVISQSLRLVGHHLNYISPIFFLKDAEWGANKSSNGKHMVGIAKIEAQPVRFCEAGEGGFNVF